MSRFFIFIGYEFDVPLANIRPTFVNVKKNLTPQNFRNFFPSSRHKIAPKDPNNVMYQLNVSFYFVYYFEWAKIPSSKHKRIFLSASKSICARF